MRDITEHRALQQQLREMNSELERQVTELEAFAYSVAHDLRAPLRAITSLTALLDEEFGEGTSLDARDYMVRIRAAATRMDALIRDLLVLSRVGRTEVEFRDVDLDGLVQTLVRELPELQPERVDVIVESPLGAVVGNDMLLTQALSNLLGNAVKFVEGEMPRIVVRSERIESRVRLWIEDNGIGIEPRFQEKIFGIFERLHTRFEGTGVGLAIVRRAIERLDGRVGVQSEPGRGSRFWIELEAATS